MREDFKQIIDYKNELEAVIEEKNVEIDQMQSWIDTLAQDLDKSQTKAQAMAESRDEFWRRCHMISKRVWDLQNVTIKDLNKRI